ncbi:RNA-binding protein lark-like [Tubulanus polymorphus]|uniref:RNA-binding protein lark-like n=1 Tax=Tubulanus polymorphus TaxID=672921 RepID=UPI003DA20BBF
MAYQNGRGGGRGGRGGGDRRGGPTVSTKVFVGSLPSCCRKGDLQALFEKYGRVVECDIVKDYGFVHFETPDDAKAAVAGLNDSEFQDATIKVELSYSSVRHKPGMGVQGGCFSCGSSGHWSKDCPKSRGNRGGGGRRGRRTPPRDMPPYGGRDRYDPYYDPYPPRDRYPPPHDRYAGRYDDPYDRRPRYGGSYPPPVQDPYRERDPYQRPPPDYYNRDRRPHPPDPYFDDGFRRRDSYRDRDDIRDYGHATGSVSGARSRGMQQ